MDYPFNMDGQYAATASEGMAYLSVKLMTDPLTGREISEYDMKQVVGGAIKSIDGVLGFKGTLGDLFKNECDITRGITVETTKDGVANIGAKIILDADYDPADILGKATGAAALALKNEFDLTTGKVVLEIAEVMTKAEFSAKCPDAEPDEEIKQ